MKMLRKAKYIAMDTEFPGIVYQLKDAPKLDDHSLDLNSYSLVRENCNKLKVIQLGLTLADENGQLVSENSIWQFNFQFDLESDECSKNAETFLKKSGIDFEKLKTDGISHDTFAE